MKITSFRPPSPNRRSALAEFELPLLSLGPEKFSVFRTVRLHVFFAPRARTCFIAEDQGRVSGVEQRPTTLDPDGGSVRSYFGDLKIAGNARGGAVLVRLARAAGVWLRPQVEADSAWLWADITNA